MATVEVNGTSLQYVEHGHGVPVVFVHGSASDYRTWQRQLEVFGESYRAIAYSRRYHWPNDKIPDGAAYAMAEQVGDLEAVLRALDATPAHLVGHSYGGLVCLLLATRAPELVRTLVLAEPPLMTLFVSIPPKPPQILRLLFHRPRTAVGIIKLGALGLGPATAAVKRGDTEAAMRLTGTAILGKRAFRDLTEERAAQVRDNLIKEELLSPESLPALDADQVRKVQRPVLLVGGDRSPRVFARLTDYLEELLPNAERTDVPDASHIMHEDNAGAYDQAVLSFFCRHSVSK